jgi:hypothetical protein
LHESPGSDIYQKIVRLQKANLKKVQQVLRHCKQTTTEICVEENYTDTRDVMGLLEIKNLEKFK